MLAVQKEWGGGVVVSESVGRKALPGHGPPFTEAVAPHFAPSFPQGSLALGNNVAPRPSQP